MAFKSQLIFDVLKNILVTKDLNLYYNHINNEQEFKTVTSFILLRYLSMHSNANVRNVILNKQLQFMRMDIKILYKLLLEMIPKQKNSYINYIK